MQAKRRLIEFDAMRSAAIVLVLLHHLEIDQRVPLFADLFRYIALGIFVFISGYLLSLNPRPMLTWKDVLRFSKKRILRILPLYILALVLFIVLFKDVGKSMTIFSFVIHCLGMQLVCSHPPQCDPVLTLWYVGLIIPFYLFFAILFKVRQTNQGKIKAGILIVLFPLFFVMLRYFTGISDKRLILYFLVFIFGIASARRGYLDRMSGLQYLSAGILLAASGIIYSLYIYPPTIHANVQPPLFSLISLSALVFTNIFMIVVIPVLYGIFKLRWFAPFAPFFGFVSYASYCTYLFHRPLWLGLSRLYYPHSLAGRQLYCAATIPVLIVVSFIIQKGYDLLLKKLEKK